MVSPVAGVAATADVSARQRERNSMRALCYGPDAPAGLRLAETAEPVPGADEALVAVRAIAFNVGEVVGLAERKQPGDVLGWDAAGVVVQPAADGSGPPPAPG